MYKIIKDTNFPVGFKVVIRISRTRKSLILYEVKKDLNLIQL